MSTRPDWDRVELLFKTALEQPAEERESYLSIACPDDVRIRNEVRSLLAAHGAAGGFLETPAVRLDGDRAAAAPSTLTPGDRLGAFEIVALLGAGGMGEVYRARDAQLGRDVAVKVLPPAFAADPQRLARFERESRVLASLNHPNIAAIHSVEHVDGLHLLVLELVDGPTLAERLGGGPLEIPDALAVARQLAAALEAAHARGIVHRDLKPSNVKLTPPGHLKLLDFGLAKTRAPDDATSISRGGSQTTAGLILGTCGYMSPEQARGEPVDKRADIWAFGCILFELLTGRAAFTGNTASETIAAVLERQPDWTSVPPGTPEGVRRLLRRCLAKDPARRLHDIADARIEIDEALDRATEADAARDTPGPQRYAAALAPILLFVLAGALAAWWVRPAGPPAAPALPLMRFVWSLPAGTRLESPPAVSPDGRMIAYTASVTGAPARLFVRALNAPEPQPVPRTEFAKQPFWSPDSRTVAYFARGTLMKVAIDGGAPVEICPAPDGRGGAWSPNGTIVFSPASIFNGLLRVPAGGGKPEPATLLDPARGENSHRWPVFLPDGIHFVYFVRAIAAERRGVYIGRVDRPAAAPGELLFRSEGEAIYVTLDGAGRGALVSTAAGQLDFRPFDARRLTVTGDPIRLPLAAGGNTPRQASMFSVSSSVLVHVAAPLPFVQRLASIDRTGAELHIDQEKDVASWPRVSPDDSRLVVQRLDSTTGSPDLWVEDLVRKTVTRITEPGTSGQLPVWSPDSLRIAYVAGPPQKSVLTIAAADGTGPLVTLKCPRARCEPSDWSSDGRWLVVNAVDSTGSDVWMIPTRDDDAPRPLLASAFVERDARLSPDGKLVAYVSEETGSPEISVQTAAGVAQREAVSAGGGSQPVWSPDGAELFFVDPKGLLCRAAVSRTPSGRPALGRAVPLDIPALGTGHFSTQYALSRAGRIYFLDRRVDDAPRDVGIVVGWQGLLGGR